jgi:2-methylisocitrate lyase-like PEP mutase family enzyme
VSADFATFAALHTAGRPFVLVNAWDVMSAVALADAGHPAIATTSLGVTAVAGLPDAARAGREPTLALVRALAGRLPVPLTVDLEDGYDDDPAVVVDLVAELAAVGVVGVNLEDAGRSAAAHARVVAAVKTDVPQMFLNARTDEFWSGDHDLDDALERCRAFRDAGADGLFVPGLTDPAELAAVVAIGPPVNALWQPGVNLASTGVARISTGSALYRYALATALDAAAAACAGAVPSGRSIDYPQTQRLINGSSGGRLR